MAAIYDEMEFGTALEARWAAFFDLAGWKWHYRPVAVKNWKPDFRVSFPCGHSECNDSHTLLVAILPVHELGSLGGHPALKFAYGVVADERRLNADAGALFGNDPTVSLWEMSHGAGGGTNDVSFWVAEAGRLWNEAGERVSR